MCRRMITVNFNGENQQIKENTSLNDWLTGMEINPKGIAVAINESIVLKNNWSSTQLKNQDKLLIIKATQGG